MTRFEVLNNKCYFIIELNKDMFQFQSYIISIYKQKYLLSNYHLTQKQIDDLKTRIKQILTYVMRAAEKKLDKKIGCFELLGCDILIGSDFTPYLIEMNHNPALHLGTFT